ncbi:MAG: hypothetical protein WCL46_07670 [Chlorobium sp.]|jgi:hypothetical protein
MKGFENQWAADFEKMLRTMAPAVIRASGYIIEWESGADLSDDTIEAQWKVVDRVVSQLT